MPERRAEPLLDREASREEDGRRADVVVAAWLDEPRARTQDRLAGGEVLVDGSPASKSRRLRSGERVIVEQPPRPKPPGPTTAVPVRYADEHLVVVAKPAGLVVHRGPGIPAGATLVDALIAMGVPLAAGTDAGRPGIVHRLDRGTSGLLVAASSPAAFSGLAAAFKARTVSRRYWAMVDGVPDAARATVDAPIARGATNRTRFVVAEAGRRAVSHYDVVEARGRAAVIDVRLETGRTHQVRVHMAAVGHPVSGDLAYGASPALAAELGLRRPALHAAHLGFDHPVTGARVELDEPLPEDLRRGLAALRKLA